MGDKPEEAQLDAEYGKHCRFKIIPHTGEQRAFYHPSGKSIHSLPLLE
jgi:hypothetical protein